MGTCGAIRGEAAARIVKFGKRMFPINEARPLDGSCRPLRCAGVLLLGATTMQAQGIPRANPMNTLMPQPANLNWQQGGLAVNPSLTIGFSAFHDQRLDAATLRMLDRLEYFTGAQLSKKIAPDASMATVAIDVRGAGEKVQSVDEDESYSLTVDGQHAQLRAATEVGAMRGMETLLQLAQLRGGAASGQYMLPAVAIQDSPRFRWRGLMIDCGRHFYPVPVILRTLDGMAAVKLNVFHWHLTEDQGFRVESKIFPKLQGMGSNGLYYTQEQVKEVVAYARDRGIRVVPEFDMPGHTTSWFVGYPELASGPGPYQVQTTFGVHDGAIDPTRESTYKFLDAFIGEMAGLFPDPYMHIGGDESNGEQWKANPKIVAFMKEKNLKDTAALQAYFNQQLLKILTKHGKHMVGWDEILHPDLPKDVVVQSWRGVDSLAAGARAGYQGILSAPYYLDAMKSSEEHYLADPLPEGSGLTATQAALVLGGEVCMWSEQIDSLDIDSRIWPRTAAMAERFWSPANVRDVNDMYRRLRVENLRLDALELTQISGPQRALRDLAGERDPAALTELASVLEPVGIGDRYDGQHTDQLTPLDRLVDAVAPDPPSRHEMELRVNLFLGDAPRYETQRVQMEEDFREWRDLPVSLEYMVAESPRMADAAPRVRQLSELGQIGLEAVFYLSHHVAPPVGWQTRSEATLAEAEKPLALVRFTVLAPLQKLVTAAGRPPG